MFASIVLVLVASSSSSFCLPAGIPPGLLPGLHTDLQAGLQNGLHTWLPTGPPAGLPSADTWAPLRREFNGEELGAPGTEISRLLRFLQHDAGTSQPTVSGRQAEVGSVPLRPSEQVSPAFQSPTPFENAYRILPPQFEPVAPLTRDEKLIILASARDHFIDRTRRGQTVPILHEFNGPQLPPSILKAFSSRAFLRYFDAGEDFFIMPRGEGVQLFEGEGGMFLQAAPDHQLFVFKRMHRQEQGSYMRTIYHFVGMIELPLKARNALRRLPHVAEYRSGTYPVGPDSFAIISVPAPPFPRKKRLRFE